MGKLKLFASNMLVYGAGGVIGKVIPLIMVPIVTRLMPNSSYYGISDMSNALLSFCSSLAVMGMYDAMYRMFLSVIKMILHIKRKYVRQRLHLH